MLRMVDGVAVEPDAESRQAELRELMEHKGRE